MKLIFVYNADSGLLNTLLDIGHKVLKPETYACKLCSLTYGNFTENRKWKDFRENSANEMEFLHKDEFREKYGQEYPCPVILFHSETLEVALSKEDLEDFQSLDELITAIEALSTS